MHHECLFGEIRKNIFLNEKIDEVLNNNLSGHINENSAERETILKHQNLCVDYFLKIAKQRSLDKIYDNILLSLGLDVRLVKTKILEAVFYHDIGKINPNFQKKCNGIISKDANHSEYSYYFLLYLNREIIKDINDKSLNPLVIATILKTIAYHHTCLENFDFEFIQKDTKEAFENPNVRTIFDLLDITDNIDVIDANKYKLLNKIKSNDLFYLIKLFYSHLVLSDYYSTFDFTYNQEIEIKKITNSLIENLEKSFEISYAYNKGIDQKNTMEISRCNSLNEIRSNLIVQAHKTIEKQIKEKSKILMLNVPTGGGKTNISLKLTLDILKHDKSINKVFWVFPYINIIEQNYNVIRKTFFGSNDEKYIEESLSMVHSSKIDKIKSSKDEESILNDFQIYLDDLFLNNPINIISNINFFEAFIKTKRSNRHKLAYLTNSVVVIDEIQTLKIKNIDFFYTLLLDISDKYNVYFIIMSATLPDLKYFTNKDVPHLIENYNDYFNSIYFSRNNIEFLDGDYNIEKVKELTIQLYTDENYKKILVCMNTVKTSITLFELVSIIGCDVFLLNSLTPVVDRIKIIDYIKKTNQKVILVSTQSIEAGVDLDFDVAIRDYSTLDSLEQVSGRVNRESNIAKVKFSKIFVIRYIDDTNYDYKKVYKSSPRLKVQEKDYYNFLKHNIFELKGTILKKKKFDLYYEEISLFLKRENARTGSLEKPLKDIETLQYESLSKEIDVIDKLPKEEVYVVFPIEIDNNVTSILDELEARLLGLNKKIKSYEIKDNRLNIDLITLFRVRNELKGFLSKSLRKRIEAILNIFSISFFIYSDGNPVELLENNGYIDNNRIASDRFKSEFLKEYFVDRNIFYYVDVPKLTRTVRELTNQSLII